MPQRDLLTDILEAQKRAGRPLAITIICVVIAIGALAGVAQTITFLAADGYFPLTVARFLATVATIATVVGLWKMKKWGVYSYIAVVTVNMITYAIIGSFVIYSLLFPLIIISILFSHFKKME